MPKNQNQQSSIDVAQEWPIFPRIVIMYKLKFILKDIDG